MTECNAIIEANNEIDELKREKYGYSDKIWCTLFT